LSQHVARLESELGTLLFDRHQSPIALTEAGTLYRNYLESNSFLYQRFLSDLSELNVNRSQSVRLGIGTWRGSTLLPNLLPPFLEAHPQARVCLNEFPVRELYPLMEDGKVDFSVMNTAPAGIPDGFISEMITYERILLVLHRDDPVAKQFQALKQTGLEPDLHLLEGKRLISLDSTLTVGKLVENYIQKNLLTFADRLVSTNNSTVLRLVAQGMGFCFLVETGWEDADQYPQLCCFDLRSSDLSLPLSLVYKSTAYLSPLVRELMDAIRQYYQSMIQRNSSHLASHTVPKT
jgi:DNA-binding transcriptional LysR family regulator